MKPRNTSPPVPRQRPSGRNERPEIERPVSNEDVAAGFERLVIGYALAPVPGRATALADIDPRIFSVPTNEILFGEVLRQADQPDVRMKVLDALTGPNMPMALQRFGQDLLTYVFDACREAETITPGEVAFYVGRIRDGYERRTGQAALTRLADAFASGDTARVREAWTSFGTLLDGTPGAAPLSPARSRIRALTYRRSQLSLIKSPGWLIDGVLNRASLAVLAGKFGTYKSFVSVAMAASIATGRPFLGHEVNETGPVIYVAAEGGSGIRARFEAWEQAHNDGQPIPDDRLIVLAGPVNLLDPEQVAELNALCGEVGPRMLVLDTMHRCAPGVEENSATEMGLVIEALSGLRERHDCTILADHHTGHGGVRSRGSSSIEDDFDNAWVIRLSGDGEDRSPSNQRTMHHRKVKDGELSQPIPIGLVACGESAYVDQVEIVPEDGAVPSWIAAREYARRLDVAGVPLSFGKDRIKKALAEIGSPSVGNTVAQSIADLRRSADYVPAKPSPTVGDDMAA